MWDIQDPVKITIAWYSKSAEAYKDIRSDLSVDEDNRRYFLDNLKGKKILDIWCAHGRDVGEFYKKGMTVTGIDLTPEFITMAKKEYPGIDLQIMDMRDLDFEDQSFDGLRSCASLLHIPKSDVGKTLEWFHRILKKWWLLFLGIKEWTGESFDKWDRFFSYRQLGEMEALLKKYKFSIQKSFTRWPKEKLWINIFATAE